MPVGERVAGVQVRSLFIPGQAISCTQIGQQDQCQVQRWWIQFLGLYGKQGFSTVA